MTLQEKINAAMEYLFKQDLKGMEPGRYDVNEDFYYLVQSYDSKPAESCRLETHKKYVDIQMVVSGKEMLETCYVGGLEVEEEYNEEKDCAFWKIPEIRTQTVLTDGGYMVLFPADAHRPGMAVGEPVPIRKIVGKVRI